MTFIVVPVRLAVVMVVPVRMIVDMVAAIGFGLVVRVVALHDAMLTGDGNGQGTRSARKSRCTASQASGSQSAPISTLTCSPTLRASAPSEYPPSSVDTMRPRQCLSAIVASCWVTQR